MPVVAAPDLEVRMSLDNALPAAGESVEFTVTVSNVGADPAADVVVKDKLPAELAIPSGMAAFPSTGAYDPASGDWTVGSLGPGASATLVIPALVAVANPPPCNVNVAETTHSLDTRSTNNRAVAAVRANAIDRCVDVAVTGGGNFVPDCSEVRHLEFNVRVTNAGPDDARDVFVDLSQDPAVAPGLRFTGTDCTGLRCTIDALAAGTTVTLPAISNDFRNRSQGTLTFAMSASTSDVDYATANNQANASGPLWPFEDCEIEIPEAAGAGGGCFVATAAYGSPLAPQVELLREFRDRYLAQHALGRRFIRLYYEYSPPLAALIAAHPPLRWVVRALLTPVVAMVAHPLRALGILAFSVALSGAWLLRPRPLRSSMPGRYSRSPGPGRR